MKIWHYGLVDLKKRLILWVGNPHRCVSEDAVRIMRGMRFAAVLGFRIDEETLSAMLETKKLLQKIAKERITSEFRGMLLGESVYDVLMSCREVIYELIPELRIEDSYIMKKYPDITLWEHTVKSVSMSKNLCERLCMLLHDVAKPSCMVMVDDKEKYPNHAEKGAEIAKEILSRFRFEKIVNTEVLKLIKNHSIRFPKALADMRRFVRDFGYDFTKDWLDIKYSDVFSKPHKESTAQLYYNAIRFFDEIDEKKLCCIISELNISGDDLKKFGIVGKNIGIVLNKLLEDVISENCKNKREVLLKQALLYK